MGDTRPAASLFHAVEHQALAGVMAERAGVSRGPVSTGWCGPSDEAGLLVMEWVDGCSLEQVPLEQTTDDLLVRLWAQVDKLHRAGIAHRSLRAANVMVSPEGLPRIVDFGFSELSATPRQMDLDVAELLASLAALAGEERAVSAAAEVLGAQGVAPAVPLLQPLALVRGHPARRRRGRTACCGRTRARGRRHDRAGGTPGELARSAAGPTADPAGTIAAAGRRVLPACFPRWRGMQQQLAGPAVGALGLGARSSSPSRG